MNFSFDTRPNQPCQLKRCCQLGHCPQETTLSSKPIQLSPLCTETSVVFLLMFLLFKKNTFFWCSYSLDRENTFSSSSCSSGRTTMSLLRRSSTLTANSATPRSSRHRRSRSQRSLRLPPTSVLCSSLNQHVEDVLIMKRSAVNEEAVKSCQIANEWARSSTVLRLSGLSDRSFISCHDHPVYRDLDNNEIWSSDGASTIL